MDWPLSNGVKVWQPIVLRALGPSPLVAFYYNLSYHNQQAMKNLLKIVFISIVILGLVASYSFLGSTTRQTVNQANTEASVNSPTNAPSTTGPSDLPPVK